MPYKRRTHLHGDLADLAARQHGVVSAKQMAALGYPRTTVADWVCAGHLHRIHRGVYAVGHAALSRDGRVMAAVLACAPAVASHRTAGRIWGLVKSNTSIHLTAPTRRHRRPDITVHFAALAPADVVLEGSIPLTSLARTLLDLAPLADPKRRLKHLERAEELADDDGHGYFDLRDFESLLERTVSHRGNLLLRKALDAHRPSPAISRSDLEARFCDLVARAGLPRPSQNVFVHAYEIDCYWPAHRFGVELDVFATHGSPRSFEEDRERADDLLAQGIEITRITDRRLAREPEAVMVRLGEHLARRAGARAPRRTEDRSG